MSKTLKYLIYDIKRFTKFALLPLLSLNNAFKYLNSNFWNFRVKIKLPIMLVKLIN